MLIIYDDIYLSHRTCLRENLTFGERGYHPESPQRLIGIRNALTKENLFRNIVSPRKANIEEVGLCHPMHYIRSVESACIKLGDKLSRLPTDISGDTLICKDSYDVALFSAGGALTACDYLMRGKSRRAFCLTRPPGHHASAEVGMGFCLFNNVAIAAKYLQRKGRLKKILIVDWDVHHGNGTQEIFYSDPSVFYFSTHNAKNYPQFSGKREEKGAGEGVGFNLNCPIEPGPEARTRVIEAFKNELASAMEEFQPECILISCGFDGHKEDYLGGFNLTTEDFGLLTQIVVELSNQYCNGRIISLLEGGYHIEATAKSALLHVQTLM